MAVADSATGGTPVRRYQPVVHAEPPPALDEVWTTWSWPSRLDHKDDMVSAVEAELSRRCTFAEDDPLWLRLCLDEAVVNAIVHGNESDPGVPVEVALGRAGDCWVVRIQDQGCGFTPHEVPDHDDPESLLLEHGRGIRLMLEWLDQLAFYRGGSCSWMARRLS